MKDCPNCKMTVEAHTKCPACKHDLTDVPYSERKWEKYAFNKYLLPYVVKKGWLSIVSFLVFAVRLVTKSNIEIWYSFIIAFLATVLCFFFSFFKNGMAELDSYKYTDSYIETRHPITRVASGIIAILFSFLW